MFLKHYLLLGLLVNSFLCGAQKQWSLEECIDYGLKNGTTIKQARLQTTLSGLAVAQNKGQRWPSLSIGVNSGYRFGLSENPTTGTLQGISFFSTGFTASSGVTLFNWFSRQHSLKGSVLQMQADGWGVSKAEYDLVQAINAAYLQVLLAKELVTAAVAQLTATATLSGVITKKIGVGVLAESDLLQVQLQALTDSATLLTAQQTTALALLQLKGLLTLSPDVLFDVQLIGVSKLLGTDALFLQPEVIYQSAVQNLPAQRQTVYQIKASEQAVKAAKAAQFPTLSLYGSAGSNYVNIPSAQEFVLTAQQPTGASVVINGASYNVVSPSLKATRFGVTPLFNQFNKNFGQNIGISLSIPVFNGKALAINQQREKIRFLQLQIQQQADNQALKTAIYKASGELDFAFNNVRLNEELLMQAEKVYGAALKRYNVNLLATQDLLITHKAVEEAAARLIVSRYNYFFMQKQVATFLSK